MRDFDLKQMRRRCLAPITDFLKEGYNLGTVGRVLIFQDNGCGVLGVAHLDSIQDTTHFETVTIRKGHRVCQRLVFSGQLDDRLGAYLLLDYLPKLGLKFDVLLTEDEERCCSTAMHFNPPRPYNWIFSFDREGEDVVLYDFTGNKAFSDGLRSAGFRLGRGTYSDICELEHLGCCGANIGTGLVNGHRELAYVDLLALRSQVARFQRFYHQHRGTPFPHTATPWPCLSLPLHYGGHRFEACEWCGEIYHTSQLTCGVCDECLEADRGQTCPGCGGAIWPDDGEELAETRWGPLCAECRATLEAWQQEEDFLTGAGDGD